MLLRGCEYLFLREKQAVALTTVYLKMMLILISIFKHYI